MRTRIIGTRGYRAITARIGRLLILTLREDVALAVFVNTHRRSDADTLAATVVGIQTDVAALAVRVLATRWRAAVIGLEAGTGSGDISSTVAVVLPAVGAILVRAALTGVGAAEIVPDASVAVI